MSGGRTLQIFTSLEPAWREVRCQSASEPPCRFYLQNYLI